MSRIEFHQVGKDQYVVTGRSLDKYRNLCYGVGLFIGTAFGLWVGWFVWG